MSNIELWDYMFEKSSAESLTKLGERKDNLASTKVLFRRVRYSIKIFMKQTENLKSHPN